MANISFTGRLSKDAELRYTPDGKSVCNLNTAENHSRKNKQTGEWEDTGTTWRRVTIFGKRAEALGNLDKGTVVAVAGREETREYTTREGNQGSSLEVIADSVGIVPVDQQGNQGGRVPNQNPAQPQGQAAPQGQPMNQSDPWGGGQQQSYDWGGGSDEEVPF